MPHSLRAYLSKARYERHITDEQYKKYIRTLDRYKALERQTGKWIDINGIYAECSNCNEEIYITGDFKYCPNCGAKMESKEQTE